MSYNESLSANSNYPPMSQHEWDNAPWNQRGPEEHNCTVEVQMTLYKQEEYTSECGQTIVEPPCEEGDSGYMYTEWYDEGIPEEFKNWIYDPATLLQQAHDLMAKLKETPYSELSISDRHKVDDMIVNLDGWQCDESDITRVSK